MEMRQSFPNREAFVAAVAAYNSDKGGALDVDGPMNGRGSVEFMPGEFANVYVEDGAVVQVLN